MEDISKSPSPISSLLLKIIPKLSIANYNFPISFFQHTYFAVIEAAASIHCHFLPL